MDRTKLIVRCSYLGMYIQAMVVNLTPLLFVPLREQFGLTFEQLGRLVLINFTTQLLVDLACAGVVDRVPIKPLVVLANVCAGAGLVLFAVLPNVVDPYLGLVLGTVVFSCGCGLLEVLLSPIIHAVPSERKAADMALLHAFYPIGKVSVVLVTAVALWWFGAEHWQAMAITWAILPAINTLGFASVTLPPLAHEATRRPLRELMRSGTFVLFVLAMVLAGATELAISQWTSAFAEAALGFSKEVADLAGFLLFAVGMVLPRLWFGLRGDKVDLRRPLLLSAAGSAAMYLVAALSPWPGVALVACVLAGVTVSLLWPGTLSLTAARFPLAGASMFALLAAAGDTGAAGMPWLVGAVADAAGGLRAGLLVAAAPPLAMVAVILCLWRVNADR